MNGRNLLLSAARGLGYLVFFCLATLMFVGLTFPEEQAKGFLSAHGARALKGKVEIGAMDVSVLFGSAELEDVASWLMLNAMRAEKVQFELWCSQCAHNVWRKRAMAVLASRHAEFGNHATVKGGSAVPEAHRAERRCLDVFRDRVEHDVSVGVAPEPRVDDREKDKAARALDADGRVSDAAYRDLDALD